MTKETELPILEVNCSACNGSGKPQLTGNMVWASGRCRTCEGSGSIPTVAGQQILDFVKKRFASR